MINELLDDCGIKRREFEHKKKMDKAYYRLNLISMILDKVPPLIFKLIKLVSYYNKTQKSRQDILHLKKLFKNNNILFRQ